MGSGDGTGSCGGAVGGVWSSLGVKREERGDE